MNISAHIPAGYRIEVEPVMTMAATRRFKRVVYRGDIPLPLGCEAETFTDTRQEAIDASVREAWNDHDERERRADHLGSGVTSLP